MEETFRWICPDPGEEKDTKMTNTTAAVTDTMRRHITAITKMLLGRATMRPGLAMVAGSLLNEAGIIRIAQLASDSRNDLIHLDFAIDGDAATLREIIIAVPRDNGVHVHRRCRLAQRPEDRHAVLLPRDEVRGHFKVAPDEIIQVRTKPADLLVEGVAFAARRLEQLVRDGVDVTGQVVLHELSR